MGGESALFIPAEFVDALLKEREPIARTTGATRRNQTGRRGDDYRGQAPPESEEPANHLVMRMVEEDSRPGSDRTR
jgi:hypothetical protein